MTYRTKTPFLCTICGHEKTVARKLCRRCYSRLYARKSHAAHPTLVPADVFEDRFEKTDGCWEWTGTHNGFGYGIFLLPGEKPVRAHRYSYEYFVGPIPEGKIIMHTCDNPPCVNPAHLRVGTKAENNADTGNKRRHHYGIGHWNGRLTPEQVADIIASTDPQKTIAKRHNINQSHVSRIKRGISHR